MAVRLRQLQAFREVARLGSMTAAAEQLKISQPAVSRLLSSFGDSVGFALFSRLGGRLIPTQESRYLLAEVERLLDSLEHIEELTQDLTNRKAGHLRIACLSGFAAVHLPGVLARFLAERPHVTAAVEPDRPERILEWIIQDQYNCGITDGFTSHPAVESQTIDIRTVCILPAGHPLASHTEIWPGDLAQERVIHTRRDGLFYQELNECFAAQGVTMNSWIEARQFSTACLLVAEGAGVSVVSALDGHCYADKGVVVRPFGPKLVHHLSILHPTHTPISLLTIDFIEAFIASLEPFRA